MIPALKAHGYGHRMFVDTGLRPPVLPFPPDGNKRLPRTPTGEMSYPRTGLIQRRLPSQHEPQQQTAGAKTSQTYHLLQEASHSWAISPGAQQGVPADSRPQS